MECLGLAKPSAKADSKPFKLMRYVLTFQSAIGSLAQLGERILHTDEVIGSSPITPTILPA